MTSQERHFEFTAKYNGQIGTAVVQVGSIAWRATGGLEAAIELSVTDIKKFQVSPKKRILRFILTKDRGDKQLEIVLTDDERRGMGSEEILIEKDRILGEARKHINAVINKKESFGTTSNSTNSNSQKEPKKAKKVASGEDDMSSVSRAAPTGWGRSLAGTSKETLGYKQTAKRKRPGGVHWKGGSGSADTQQKIDDSVQQKELERQCKKQLLAKDKGLNEQHQQLVGEGVISDEDFWESRRAQLQGEIARMAGKREGLESWQERWQNITSRMSTSEGNAMGDSSSKKTKITLTPPDLQKIFALYPKVKKLYLEKVPGEISEKKFWESFFRSNYFAAGGQPEGNAKRRTPLPSASVPISSRSQHDMFGGCGDLGDNEETKQERLKRMQNVDPTIDLVSIYGDYVSAPMAADVYQPVKTKTLSADEERQFLDDQIAAQAREKLIHGYNRRADRWLLAASDKLDDQGAATIAEAARDVKNCIKDGDDAFEQPWPSRSIAGSSWLGDDSSYKDVDPTSLAYIEPSIVRKCNDNAMSMPAESNTKHASQISLDEKEQARCDILEAATVLPELRKDACKGARTVPLTVRRPLLKETGGITHDEHLKLLVGTPVSENVSECCEQNTIIIKRFNATLNASGPHALASSPAILGSVKEHLVERTQRVHELFRHLFALIQKCQREARRRSVAEVAEVLSDNEKKKLKKIEGALEKILDGVRQDKKAVADGGDRELLFKSLEAQLNHGFEAIQKFRGEEVSNGFVAVS